MVQQSQIKRISDLDLKTILPFYHTFLPPDTVLYDPFYSAFSHFATFHITCTIELEKVHITIV